MLHGLTEADYTFAKALQAIYEEHCKPYVQKNGWTVIPAGTLAPLDMFGEPVTAARVIRASSIIERWELMRDKPERFVAYVRGDTIVIWTGHVIGHVTWQTNWSLWRGNNRRRTVHARMAWGGAHYYGIETDSGTLVNMRRSKGE